MKCLVIQWINKCFVCIVLSVMWIFPWLLCIICCLAISFNVYELWGPYCWVRNNTMINWLIDWLNNWNDYLNECLNDCLNEGLNGWMNEWFNQSTNERSVVLICVSRSDADVQIATWLLNPKWQYTSQLPYLLSTLFHAHVAAEAIFIHLWVQPIEALV